MGVPRQPESVRRYESRFLPVLISVGLVLLLEAMPTRYTILPRPVGRSLEIVFVTSLVVAGVSPPTSVWATVERWVVWIVVALEALLEIVVLKTIMGDIIFHHHQIAPLTMLSSAVALWTMNVLIFSFVYWQLDRGGPAGRATGWTGRADFTFTQGNPTDGVPAGWQPGFADYFFLGFNTSIAFSPTDTLPLTPRAKFLMAAQSMISLITLVIVAARAINVLT